MTESHKEFLKGRTILLVDDDDDFRFQLRMPLEAAGCKVLEADTADDAREMLTANKPDLAVVDLMMEEVDAGFTLCYHIKKNHPNVPVVLVTGVASETGIAFGSETREERSWVKADALLNKPIRFEQLRKEIERLL